MASQVTNYKCPACTGPLHFVGASGKLVGDLPTDMGRFWTIFAAVAAPVAAIAAAVMMLL